MPTKRKRLATLSRRRLAAMWQSFLDKLTRLVLGPKRLDHEPMYSCTHAGVVIGAFSIIIAGGPAANGSALATLAGPTQQALAACMSTGSLVCLYGISMGTCFDIYRQGSKIVRRLMKKDPPLALDIRRPYRVAACSTPTTIIGMGYYCSVISTHSAHLIVGLTGMAFIGFASIGLFFQWLRFLMEIRRIDRTVPILIKQEIDRRIVEQWLNP